jgi:hypothetical protein
MTVSTAAMTALYKSGLSVGEVAAATGLTYQTVYYRLGRAGVLKRHRAKDTHPLTRIKRHRIGARVGKPTDLPDDVAERIIADVAKHGGTLWDAVGRIINKQEK